MPVGGGLLLHSAQLHCNSCFVHLLDELYFTRQ